VLTLITAFLAAIGVITSLEVLALRQQIAVLKRRWPEPSLNRFDRFVLDHYAAHMAALVRSSGHLRPEILIGWHRAGLSPLLALAIGGCPAVDPG